MRRERWRDVTNYEGLYQVSDLGRVRSLPCAEKGRWKAGRILKPGPGDRYGHLHVILCRAGLRNRTAYVHNLVLEAFVGPRPPRREGAHRDGNPSNNQLTNLRWTSHQENEKDKITHGTSNQGSRHGMAKLTEQNVIEIRERRAQGERVSALAEQFSVHQSAIYGIVSRRRWAHVAEGSAS